MKYFTINELTNSATAKQMGIKNKPNEQQEKNLVRLIDEILDPIREAWGSPIRVNSGFRCEKLNNVVGGSKTSQHLSGSAADIVPYNRDTKGLFEKIKELINNDVISVGQNIDEKNYSWIHISLPDDRHHNQILHL